MAVVVSFYPTYLFWHFPFHSPFFLFALSKIPSHTLLTPFVSHDASWSHRLLQATMENKTGFGLLYDFGTSSDGFDVMSGSRSISAPPSMNPHRKALKAASPNIAKTNVAVKTITPHRSIPRSVSSLGNVKRASTLTGVNWKFLGPDKINMHIVRHGELMTNDETHDMAKSPVNYSLDDPTLNELPTKHEDDMATILQSQLNEEIYNEHEREVIGQYLSRIMEHESDLQLQKAIDDDFEKEFAENGTEGEEEELKEGVPKSNTNLSLSQKAESAVASPIVKTMSASNLISTCKKEIESSTAPLPVNKRLVVKLTPMNMSKSALPTPLSKTPSMVSGAVSDGNQNMFRLKDPKMAPQSSTASIVVQKAQNSNTRVNKQLHDAFKDYPLNEELEKLKSELGLGQHDENSASDSLGRDIHKNEVNPKMLKGILKLEIREASYVELPLEWDRVLTIESDLGHRKRTGDGNLVHPKLQPPDSIIV